MMKPFIYKVIIYFVVIAGITLVVFSIMMSLPNPYSYNSHEANLSQQIKRMQQIKEPKIVFIGGSGCGFGICSKMVSDHFLMPVCNTGIHAGMGLQAQIDLFKKYINAKDVIIVIPEYEQYLGNFYLGGTSTLRIITSNYPMGYKDLNMGHLLYLLRYIPQTFSETMSAILSNSLISQESPYSKFALNEYGDIENYDYRSYKEANWTEHPLDGDVEREVINVLSELDTYCRNRNAIMILFPPAYKGKEYDYNKDKIDQIWSVMTHTNILLGANPIDYRMADSLHYDTRYHLSYEGVLLRTSKLISDIDSLQVIH